MCNMYADMREGTPWWHSRDEGGRAEWVLGHEMPLGTLNVLVPVLGGHETLPNLPEEASKRDTCEPAREAISFGLDASLFLEFERKNFKEGDFSLQKRLLRQTLSSALAVSDLASYRVSTGHRESVSDGENIEFTPDESNKDVDSAVQQPSHEHEIARFPPMLGQSFSI